MRILMSRIKWKRNRAGDGVRVLSLLSVFALGTPGILAQVVGQSNIEPTKSTERPDAWRFLPQEVPPDPPDPREKELLVVRGSDEGNPNLTPFDQPPLNKPAPSPLDQILRADTESQGQSSVSRGYYGAIPFVDGEAIVFANFQSYQTHFTPSRRSIYTIVNLEVGQVLYAGDQALNVGQVIDLMMSGGTLRLNDGRVVTYGIQPENARDCIQPGHQYLLLLKFNKESDTFHMDESIFWDITTGTAVPSPTARNISVGQTVLAGLPEERFLELVRKAVDQHK